MLPIKPYGKPKIHKATNYDQRQILLQNKVYKYSIVAKVAAKSFSDRPEPIIKVWRAKLKEDILKTGTLIGTIDRFPKSLEELEFMIGFMD